MLQLCWTNKELQEQKIVLNTDLLFLTIEWILFWMHIMFLHLFLIHFYLVLYYQRAKYVKGM